MTRTSAPIPHERHDLVAGVPTRMLSTPGRGPVLLLLHGFGDSADGWRPLLQHLGDAGLASVAPDLPGFGHSAPLRREALLPQWDDFVVDLVRQVAEQSGRSVVLVGNSLGGLIALRSAQRDDLPVAGVVPIAPGGFDRPRWLRLLSDDLLLRRLLSLPVPVPRRLVGVVLSQLYLRGAFFRPAAIDPSVVAAFSAHHPDKRSIRRLVAVGRALAREAAAGDLRLDHVRCPMLVVWGADDRLMSPAGADLIAEVVAGTEIVLIPECGHLPQVERPDVVAQALSGFLASRRVRRNTRRRR